MKIASSIVLALSVSVVLTGCGGGTSAEISSPSLSAAQVDSSKYLLAEEPDDAVGVIAARETAKDGDPIVIVGRIGGAKDPWVEGRAAFMLLDASMVIVAEGTDGEDGEICMDDCCASERADSTTLVKVVDESGKVLAVDARKLLGVSADDMVVVRGSVRKDDAGNFVVLARGVHVRH